MNQLRCHRSTHRSVQNRAYAQDAPFQRARCSVSSTGRGSRAVARAAVAETADAASLPLEQLEQQPGVPVSSQLEQLKQKLENELAQPAVPGAANSNASSITTITSSSRSSTHSSIHQWGNGAGLTVEQFKAALQSLPMQRRVRWKSMYPAIGTGSRGQVFHAINLDTGESGSAAADCAVLHCTEILSCLFRYLASVAGLRSSSAGVLQAIFVPSCMFTLWCCARPYTCAGRSTLPRPQTCPEHAWHCPLRYLLRAGGTLAVKVVALSNHMGPGREAALRREALVLELAAMQDYRHPHLMPMQVCA
jgi:hypothetical protein